MRVCLVVALLGLGGCATGAVGGAGPVNGLELGMKPTGTRVDVLRVLDDYNRALDRRDAEDVIERVRPGSLRRYGDVLRHARGSSDSLLDALPAWTSALARRLRRELTEQQLETFDAEALVSWLGAERHPDAPPLLYGVVRHVAMEGDNRAIVTLSTRWKDGAFYEVVVVRELADWQVELPAPGSVP